MRDLLSIPDTLEVPESSSTMSSSSSPEARNLLTTALENRTPPALPNHPDQKTDQNPQISDQSDAETLEEDKYPTQAVGGGDGEGQEDEEEGECPFCLFMKGGGCKESFIAWENCVEEAENNKEDIVGKCMEITATLKTCMDAHQDYYAPILQAEKAAEEEAVTEFGREAAEKDTSTEKEKVKKLEQEVAEELKGMD